MSIISASQLRRLELRLSQLYDGSGHGLHLGKLAGVGSDRHEIRRWRRGDRDQIINWNVTAQTGDYLQPMVWPYARDHDFNAAIIVDCDERLNWGGAEALELKLPLQLQIAHLLSALASLQDDSVGLHTQAGSLKTGASLSQIRSHLSKVQPDEANGFARTLHEFSNRNTDMTLMAIVISDFLGDGWQQPLKAIARRQEVVAIQVTDPWDFTIPTGLGRAVIGGKRYDFGDVKLCESYSIAAEKLQAETSSSLRGLGANVKSFSTSADVWRQFIDNFRRDGRPARRRAA